MTNRVIPIGSAVVSLLALASSASADVKVNDNFSVSGYAAGSYRYFNEAKTDKFDLDAAKINFLTNFSPVSGVASIYYTGAQPGDDLTLLDAYVSYDLGDGTTITGGKFLSWLGFEAFDIPNMYQITYANGDFLAAIPAYHSGVKFNFSDKTWSGGVAVLDSIYGGFEGDGELRGNAGYEAYLSFTGVEGLTLWGGVAYQTEGAISPSFVPANPTLAPRFIGSQEEAFVLDFWASYQINKDILVAAEYVTKDSYYADGYNWLAFLNYSFDEKTSMAFRVSGEELDANAPLQDGPSFIKYTIAPAIKVTDNLTVRLEVSHYRYDDDVTVTRTSNFTSKDTFIGVQGVFKF